MREKGRDFFFVVRCESLRRIAATGTSSVRLRVHPGYGRDGGDPRISVASAPKMGSPSRSAADNRPFCV